MPVSVLITSEFAISPVLEAQWLDQLPQERRDHICRWPDQRERRRSLLGSRLLRGALQRLGYPVTAMESLRYPLRARPTLELPVHFSLSHCAGRILCALSSDGPVGVDVEVLGGLTADEFLLYLNAAERAWAGTSAQRFSSTWTRKEAVAKAAGTSGLPVLREIDTSTGERCAAYAGHAWQTVTVPVGTGYIAHLALPRAGMQVTFERVRGHSLQGGAT